MSAVVIDARIGVKWFVPEIYSPEARQWRGSGHDLHVPEFFFDLEIAAVLWKKIQRSEISRQDADHILAQLPSTPVARNPDGFLLTDAFNLANRTQRTVYDCLYLALAIRLGGRMVTADQRLYNGLSATPLAAHVCWVGDISSALP